jgi:hypothetical protein
VAVKGSKGEILFVPNRFIDVLNIQDIYVVPAPLQRITDKLTYKGDKKYV